VYFVHNFILNKIIQYWTVKIRLRQC